MPDDSDPKRLIIELVLKRAGQGPEGYEPRAFSWKTQTYERQTPREVRQAQLNWPGTLQDALVELSKPGGTRRSEAQLGAALTTFLRDLGFELTELVAAVHAKVQVHVVLRFHAAELYALPWELVRVDGQDLGNIAGVDLRYELPGAAGNPARQRTDGRVFLAWSSAGGGVPAKDHVGALTKALTDGGLPKPELLAGASYAGIAKALSHAKQSGRPITILHLLAHGGMVEGQHVGLVLDDDDDDDDDDDADGRTLGRLLAKYRDSLRLVVLCACRSADPGPLDSHLGSLAQELSDAGIESVIASRMPLSSSGSTILARSLFTALADADAPASLETALARARSELLDGAHPTDALSLQRYARPTPQGSYDTRPLVFRPYRGLQAFGPEHRRFFFGRDVEIEELLTELEALLAPDEARIQVVEGASGSGKSSLVMAGLVPALLAEGTWAWLRVVPGAEPLAALELELSKVAAIDRGLRVLLVVDQFEELFTYEQPRELRNRFGARLWQIATEVEGRISVVCTMRTDFRGRCGEVQLEAVGTNDDHEVQGRFLDSLFNDGRHDVYVPRMPPERLIQVIEGPAQRVGLLVADGLATLIATEIGGEPGALPLLQFTMDKVWERQLPRADGSLRQTDYKQVGGVVGALEQRAEAILGAWADEQLAMARRLLVRLVSRDGGGARETRRRVPLDELRPEATKDRERFDAVLAKLVDERLLVRSLGPDGGAQVEVAHEALIRSWKQLRDWLDADREMLAAVAQVDKWAAEWKAGRLDLLSGNQLGFARQVLETWGEGELGADARALLKKSERKERKRHEEERKRHEEERKREAKQREGEAKERRRLRGGLASAVVVVVAVVTLVFVILSKNDKLTVKETQLSAQLKVQTKLRATSERQRILADAAAVGDTAPQLGLLLAVEAYERTPQTDRRLNSELGQVLLDGVARSGGYPLRGHESALRGAAIDARGQVAVTWASTPPALAWDLREHPPRSQSFSVDSAILNASLTSDGAELVSHDEAGRVRVWSLESGRVELVNQLADSGRVSARVGEELLVAHGPDDDVLVAGERLWVRADGRWREHVRHEHIHDVAFARGERRVVIATASELIVEDLDEGSRRRLQFDTRDDSRTRVSSSLDGQWLLSAQNDEITLWRPDNEASPVGASESVEGREVVVLGFATDPATAIAVTDEGLILSWALNHEAALTRDSHLMQVDESSSFIDLGRSMVDWAALLDRGLFTSGGQARVRDHGDPARVFDLNLGGSFVRSSVSHGDQLFAGLQDGSIVSWDLGDPDPNWTRTLRRGHDRYVNGLWISGDGQRMISAALATANGYTGYEVDRPEARLWTREGRGEIPLRVRDPKLGGFFRILDWSPDGRYITSLEFSGLFDPEATLDVVSLDAGAPVIELPWPVTTIAHGVNIFATAHGGDGELDDPMIHLVNMGDPTKQPRSIEAAFSVDRVEFAGARWLVAHHIGPQAARAGVWDVASPSLDQVELPPKTRALAFAPDAVRACLITSETMEAWSFAGRPTRVGEPLRPRGGVPFAVGVVGDSCVALVDQPDEDSREHVSLASINLDDGAARAEVEIEPGLGRPIELSPASDAVLLETKYGCAVIGLDDGRARVSSEDCDSAVVAADGSRLVVSRNDRHVPFELPSWRRGNALDVAELKDHSTCVPLLSPDGALLITAGRDDILIYDLDRPDDGRIIALPRDSEDPWFGCPALSPDGHRLAVNTLDGLAVWPLELEVLVEAARETAGREFTSWELERYSIARE